MGLCKDIVARTVIMTINRLAFRIFFTVFYSNLKRKHFVLGHNLYEEFFSQLSSILIEKFCSYYIEPI